MTATTAHITAVDRLLQAGEASQEALAGLDGGRAVGLWAPSADGRRVVATRSLVQLGARLPSHEETVAAVLACEPDLQAAWLGIVAARLKEMGGRRDAAGLCAAIEQLGAASGAILEHLQAKTALTPGPSPKGRGEEVGDSADTGRGELETVLFAAPAEQAVALPRLLRAVGATASLVEGHDGEPAASLADVDLLAPSQAWCPGRLLRLPEPDQPLPVGATSVLTGSLEPLAEREQVFSDLADQALMRWALYRPWATLLAQVVFTQEAWAAEQISGGMALELSEDQLSSFHEPGRVDVVIGTPDGEEIVCGTLGELLRRILARLDVTVLARPEELADLDESLAPVIHLLLEKKVWRYDPHAGLSRRPGYVIDDGFSTSCYRTFGSKFFYRLGSVLTGAIRVTCERWAQERLTKAGIYREKASV